MNDEVRVEPKRASVPVIEMDDATAAWQRALIEATGYSVASRRPDPHIPDGACGSRTSSSIDCSSPVSCRGTEIELTPIMRILIIEDDRKIASFLERGLREDGYAVDVAHDGNEGLTNAHVYDYDALIVDILLPGRNGYEIVRELRGRGKQVPVLMLTARDAKEDIVLGLDVGADDYLTKPFSFDELLARLRALLRRGGARRTDRLVYKELQLDRLRHRAEWRGADLDLTPKEFQLLEYFALHPEQVIRRTELLEKVWDLHFDPMTNVVDVHVGHLRRKLQAASGTSLIHTLRGVGYMLSDEPPP